MPVRRRLPRGTRRRAPIGGSAMPSGRAYVRGPSPGTGTATSTLRTRSILLAAADRGGQERPRSLEILPCVALAVGAPQQERRVEGRDQFGAAEVIDPAAQARDRVVRSQQRLRGERAQRDDDARTHGVDLAEQERLARFDFV